MLTAIRGQSITRATRWLIAGLLAISAVLFVIGVAVERTGENPGVSAVQPGATPAKSVDSDGGEGHVDTLPTVQTTPAQNESVLGINLENPWIVGAAVLSSLILIEVLLRFGYPVLPVIVLFAIGAVLFDVGEVLRQIQRNNTNITLLAGLVLVAHAAVAMVSLLSLYKYRASASHSGPRVPSISS